jgi:tetratricopeptide (TPR) repeat protein
MNSTQIELIYGTHGTEELDYIVQLESTVERILAENPEGYVYIFLEHAGYPQSISDLVTELVSYNIPPTVAYYLGEYAFAYGYLPKDPEDLADYAYSMLEEPENIFEKRVLEIADSLFAKYNLGKLNPRLRLIIEGADDETYIEDMEANRAMQTSIDTYLQFMQEGNFEEALKYFKEAAKGLSSTAVRREARIIAKIQELSAKADTNGIVGIYGVGHTRISHELRKLRVPNTLSIPNKDKLFLNTPLSVVAKRILYKGEESISDLDWQKAMVSEFLLEVLKAVSLLANEDLSEQARLRVVYKQAALFKSLNELKKFEQLVVDLGYLEACLNIDSVFV